MQSAATVAVIVYGDVTIECTVADMSSGGARLTFFGFAAVPQHFELKMLETDVARRCHVVWRQRNEVGARFLS